MEHNQISGLVWGLTRLQCQFEAIVQAIEHLQPDFRQQVSQELGRIRQHGRMREIWVENQREVEKASDGIWLIQNGLGDDSPLTEP